MQRPERRGVPVDAESRAVSMVTAMRAESKILSAQQVGCSELAFIAEGNEACKQSVVAAGGLACPPPFWLAPVCCILFFKKIISCWRVLLVVCDSLCC